MPQGSRQVSGGQRGGDQRVRDHPPNGAPAAHGNKACVIRAAFERAGGWCRTGGLWRTGSTQRSLLRTKTRPAPQRHGGRVPHALRRNLRRPPPLTLRRVRAPLAGWGLAERVPGAVGLAEGQPGEPLDQPPCSGTVGVDARACPRGGAASREEGGGPGSDVRSVPSPPRVFLREVSCSLQSAMR